MLRHKRKLLSGTLLVGLAITLLIILADQLGWMSGLEKLAYDRRARIFQHFAPPPTERLIHLDIDDRALQVVGRWPWPRAKLAEILDEIHLAGPKVVGLDILFSEPQEVDYRPLDPNAAENGPMQKIDHDALLADAIRRSGNVILPVALIGGDENPSSLLTQLRDIYRHDLVLSDAQVVEQLHHRGFAEGDLADAVSQQSFLTARRKAAYDVVFASQIVRKPPLLGELAPRLIHTSIDERHSPLSSLLQEAFEAADRSRVVENLAVPLPRNAPRIARVQFTYTTPLARFSKAAVGTAFVDHHFDGDPVVRNTPLTIACDSRVFLQLGLEMACKSLDVDPRKIEFRADRIILPRTGGEKIIIPVRTSTNRGSSTPLVFDIPWTGGAAWETMYDFPAHRESRQHLSINKAWDICLTRHKIEANNRTADQALATLLGDGPGQLAVSPDLLASFLKSKHPTADTRARLDLAQAAMKELDSSGFEAAYADLAKSGTMKEDEKLKYQNLLAAKSAIAALLRENQKLQAQLIEQRQELSTELKGRAVLVGLTSTSSSTDVVSTSLHDRCPGVVVHGAIYNAIMTRRFWTFAPQWLTPLITLLLGASTAFIAAWLTPTRASLAAAAILAAYVGFNGSVLFDHYRLIVGLAGPCTAVALVWGGCVLLRTVAEQHERALVTRRFQAYVDPTLVDYVLEHPERNWLQGEIKELTVLFSDLANFTTISEALGERSVSLLNEYMAEMVPIIRRHNGYVNKFLGDGIMCFFGAPRDNPHHAADAVKAAIEMREAMQYFNARHIDTDLPQLLVRIGISTGQMVVGDAGSADCSDYTVLGDAVNLGSRLESANKYLGTRILVSSATASAAKDVARFCPIGTLRVVGKAEGVEVFTTNDFPAQATDAVTEMVWTYRAGDFAGCLAAAERAKEHLPKLAALYRERCDAAKPADFDGTISLQAK